MNATIPSRHGEDVPRGTAENNMNRRAAWLRVLATALCCATVSCGGGGGGGNGGSPPPAPAPAPSPSPAPAPAPTPPTLTALSLDDRTYLVALYRGFRMTQTALAIGGAAARAFDTRASAGTAPLSDACRQAGTFAT